MLGVIINSAAVIFGSLVGVLFKKLLPEKLGNAVMKGVALCVIYIGVSGMLKDENTLIMILSMVIGAVLGTLLNLDGKLRSLGEKMENSLVKKEALKGKLAEAFVSSTLLFCVGAMAVVGSLSSGLSGDNSMLFAKATLDGVSAVVLASTLGIGVIFSSASLLVYQGAIVLLASVLSPLLGGNVIAEMTAVGSLLIIAMGLNMLGITKIKAMDYTPAIFMPIVLIPLADWLGSLGIFG